MNDLDAEREEAAQALQNAVERFERAWGDEPAIVSDYIVLISTTSFTADGDTAEGFRFCWPHDARTGYTMALGLLDRAHRHVYRALDGDN